MSLDAMRWAWKSDIASSGALFVLIVLADHAGDHDGEDWTCFPAVSKIVDRTRLKERAVEEHLKWLIEQGWISRSARGVRKAGKGKFVYTLHRGRPAASPANAAGEAGSCSPEYSAGEDQLPSAAEFAGESAGFDPQISQASPAENDKPPRPPYKAEPKMNPHSARAGVEGADDPCFEAVLAAFASAAPTSVARPRDWAAWLKVTQRIEPARLVGAAERYLAHVAAHDGKVFSLERWLRDAKWEPFLSLPDAPAPPPPRPTWPGPPEIRDQLVARASDRLMSLYLDRAGWDAGRRVIVAAKPSDVERFRMVGNLLLGELGIEGVVFEGMVG